jgi:hypothetical protein
MAKLDPLPGGERRTAGIEDIAMRQPPEQVWRWSGIMIGRALCGFGHWQSATEMTLKNM